MEGIWAGWWVLRQSLTDVRRNKGYILWLCVCSLGYSSLYRVIHKSVKHFKNSQQINYSTDHGSSYADREREKLSKFFFLHISQTLNLSTFGSKADIYTIAHLLPHVSAYRGRPEPQQRWYGCENLEISGGWRHKDSFLHKPPEEKSRTGLNPGTALTFRHHTSYI